MENTRFIIKDYQKDNLGIGNIFKCLISAISVNDDTVIQCYDDYIYGKYDTILDDKFIYHNQTDKLLEKVYTCRLLIHKSEEDIQEDIPNEEWYLGGLENPNFDYLFSFTKRIDWNYNPDRINSIVKDRIFKNIDKIIFKPIIYNIVDYFYNSFKLNTSLGISVRTWTSSHEGTIDRPYSFDIYKSKIMNVLINNMNIDKIVLSVDNESALEQYLKIFEDIHIPCVVLKKDDRMNDIQFAIIKALTLAKCNYFIGNRISTFSELVFWFSRHTIKVYTVF